MSTHNVSFCQEIRKILCGYHLLSVAMEVLLKSTTTHNENVHMKICIRERIRNSILPCRESIPKS